MSHNRAPKPGSKWYLPFDTYKYVVNFCYAYGDMKQKYGDLDGQHAHQQDGMPRGTETSDPTSSEGMRRANLGQKISTIEKAVDTVVPESVYGKEMRLQLFLGVTKRGITYTYLSKKLGMACTKNEYSELRRQVYWIIAERIM